MKEILEEDFFVWFADNLRNEFNKIRKGVERRMNLMKFSKM